MSILNSPIGLVLNKGGAGTTMSRRETVDALTPVMEQHVRLNHAYEQLIALLGERPLAGELRAEQRVARMDVGKLAETMLSAGGTPYSGTQIEPGSEPLPADPQQALEALREREQALLDAVERELDADHQIRTRAILQNVQTHSQNRFKIVDRAAAKPLA